MDVIYADTINSFASDLNNLWQDNKTRSGNLNKTLNNVVGKDNNNCSLRRFLLSSRSSPNGNEVEHNKNGEKLSNIERLAKTASIWTRPDLTRVEADNILQDFEKGIFIIRMTTDQKTMVLSYRGENKAQHVLIKVDVTRGFYMDGSQNVFRNVNSMISHYMSHVIQNPDIYLKLPKSLRESYDPIHFKFFENLKIDFWKSSFANKGIDEIWVKDAIVKQPQPQTSKQSENTEINPPLPPRDYDLNDLNIIQGSAEMCTEDSETYEIIKKTPLKPKLSFKNPSTNSPISSTSDSNDERIYSELWMWNSEYNFGQKNINLQRSDIKKPGVFSINDIITTYYPEIMDSTNKECKQNSALPSLTVDIMKIQMKNRDNEYTAVEKKQEKDVKSLDSSNEGLYETPWDIQAPWITKLMDVDTSDLEKQSKIMSEMVKDNSLDENSRLTEFSSIYDISDNSTGSLNTFKKVNDMKLIYYVEEEEDDIDIGEDKLMRELLAEIQPVMFSSSELTTPSDQIKSQYGQGIRKYLTQLCSRKGTSDISQSVRIFIKCTIDRKDLSPYTTMRLIRQYMSGLKNLIKQQKSGISFTQVIEEERKKTPKNVFINLDSIMESVLTKEVVKPLTGYVYRLLVLEHYKNSNMKMISSGVEVAERLEPTKLGLKNFSISLIDSQIKVIKKKFRQLSETYSPEKKIGHLISLMEIVFETMKLIYPDSVTGSMAFDIKTDNLLSVLVYIFSKCKCDAIAIQCEVEYIEGLLWSSSLVNGEPGFYLMNIMSSIEAIKVLARPLDLKSTEQTNNPLLLAAAAVGSVNVIILDEKINRLVTKTYPIRETISSRTLCNTIAHRLGIFNPMEYSLFKFTGSEEVLIDDFEYPLKIKRFYQQIRKETINFLFKRKHATFILPPAIAL